MKLDQQVIPYGSQWIDEEDIDAVIATLKSGWITQGPKIREFEEKFAKHVGAKYAIALSNGTAALHLIALALGIKKDSEVITTPITFLATANAVLYAGGNPVFADIDPANICLDPAQVIKRITPKTKAVFAVHMAGHPADLQALQKICSERNLILIEDAAHALGAKYKNQPIGNSNYSKAAIFSFHPVKHITTGEGGMITTNDGDLYEKLCALRTHGVVNQKDKFVSEYEGPWQYEMQTLGFNYRITDFQAALGIQQLSKLDMFVEKRRAIAKKYNNSFKQLDQIILPSESQDAFHSYHLYVVQLKLEQLKKSRKEIFEALRSAGIGVQVHYIPIPRQPFYKNLGFKTEDYPKSEKYYQSAISLPVFPKMTDDQIDYVIRTVTNILNEARK